jgi:hypothetical protein
VTCRAVRGRMTLRYYGAIRPDEIAADESHVQACQGCALEWGMVRRVLDAIEPGTVFPQENGVDWDRFARRTVERALAAERARPAARWFLPTALRLALVAAILAAGVVALSVRMRQEPPQAPPVASLLESAHVIERRLAQQGAVLYLNDSRLLLMNIGAAVPCIKSNGRYDITLEKEKSRQLLRRKNLYEGDLGGLQDRRLATLVGQLESVLMQVAALDDCASARQIHDLREEIERRQILLRIDLLTRQMAGRTDVV